MAVSKLFTPVLRASQPTAIEKSESAEIFMNPPTHPEIPVFSGNSNDDGKAIYPLKLGGERGSATKGVTVYDTSAAPDTKQNY